MKTISERQIWFILGKPLGIYLENRLGFVSPRYGHRKNRGRFARQALISLLALLFFVACYHHESIGVRALSAVAKTIPESLMLVMSFLAIAVMMYRLLGTTYAHTEHRKMLRQWSKVIQAQEMMNLFPQLESKFLNVRNEEELRAALKEWHHALLARRVALDEATLTAKMAKLIDFVDGWRVL